MIRTVEDVHLIEYASPVSSATLTFIAIDASQTMFIQNLVPVNQPEALMLVINSQNDFDISYTDDMVAVSDNIIEMTMLGMEDTVDMLGSVTFTPMGAQSVKVIEVPSGSLIAVSNGTL